MSSDKQYWGKEKYVNPHQELLYKTRPLYAHTDYREMRKVPEDVKEVDQVNSPDHYKGFDIECIDAMLHCFGPEEVKVFAKLNSFKYLWRSKRKGKEQEDLDKAAWYTKLSQGIDPRTGEKIDAN